MLCVNIYDCYKISMQTARIVSTMKVDSFAALLYHKDYHGSPLQLIALMKSQFTTTKVASHQDESFDSTSVLSCVFCPGVSSS